MKRDRYEPEKSHVSMEQVLCMVCATPYDSGSILLDRRLRKSLERHTVTGWGELCDACKARHAEGYLACVEVDPATAELLPNGNCDLRKSPRTGRVFHLRYAAATAMFNVPFDPEKNTMVVIDPKVGDWLLAKLAETEPQVA